MMQRLCIAQVVVLSGLCAGLNPLGGAQANAANFLDFPVVEGTVLTRAEQLEIQHRLSMEFETPHTKWAKPYGGGKTRVLCFSRGQFFAGGKVDSRWIIELLQRFDLEAEPIYWMEQVKGYEKWRRWLQERAVRLMKQQWDVIILHKFPLSDLPEQLQQSVLEAVRNGTGLVLVGVSDARVVNKKNRIEPPPSLQAADTFQVDKGRVVRLLAAPNIGFRFKWMIPYDYWAERLGRATLWAGRHEPKMQLTVAVDKDKISHGDLVDHGVTVAWKDSPQEPVRLQIVLRGERGFQTRLVPKTVEEETGTIQRQLPLLPADQYHVDVRGLADGRIVAWATTPFTVTSMRKVNTIELDKEWYEVGDHARGTLTLAGKPVPHECIEVRLRDFRRARILAKTELEGTSLDFSFPIPTWMPMAVWVEAAVFSGAQQVVATDSSFRVTNRHRDRFNMVVWWMNPGGVLQTYLASALERLGTTVILPSSTSVKPEFYFAAHDMATVPYSTRIRVKKDENGVMLDPDKPSPTCWNDDKSVDKYVQRIVDYQHQARAQGTFAYSLGDEISTYGSCSHPACLSAYRRYLEQQYGNITALNASWGTNYSDFNEVPNHPDPKASEKNATLPAENHAPGYDRHAFECFNLVQLCKRFDKAFKQMDPEAITGFEGSGGLSDDYDLIVRNIGFWAPYAHTGDEIIRSIAPRSFRRSNWMGYQRDADRLMMRYWRIITRGGDSVFYWMSTNIGHFHGLLAPHWGPYPAIRKLVDETQIVRDGLGTLLTNSDMQDDGIAMLYSHPSSYAQQLENGPTFGWPHSNHRVWHWTIRELGLQFRYVTDRMLRRGEFDSSKFKVLILPQSEAIGVREVQVIEEFVRKGGMVIADVRPGLYDGHCKPLAAGALDTLFGIRRTGRPAAQTKAVAISFDDPRATFSFDSALCDAGIVPAGARQHGKKDKIPLVLINRVGKGQAVLLNCVLHPFVSLENQETFEAASERVRDQVEMLDKLFTSAGVQPVVRTLTEDGTPVRNLETIRWQNGKIELVALFRHKGEPADVKVSVPASKHVYDLRNRRYLGHQQTFSTRLLPSRPTFLVLSSEELPQLQPSLSQAEVQRGDSPELRLAIPNAAGLHALRIRAETPSGDRADWLAKVLLVGKDPQTVTLPIAYNDPTGQWKIRIIDLYTQKAEQVVLTVR